MLQEATKIINSAFHNGFTRKICQYLHDCVREEFKSSTFRNLKQDKDNKWLFLTEAHLMPDYTTKTRRSKAQLAERLFTEEGQTIMLDGEDSYITDLMTQSNKGLREKYLICGYLFIVGKNSKSRRYNEFLTPLLYMPCKLEREELGIKLTLTDDVISLNTGALTALIAKNDNEDEIEYMLEGLLDVVPKLPLTQKSLQIFLTTLKSLIPDIEIKSNYEINEDSYSNMVQFKSSFAKDEEEDFYDGENFDDNKSNDLSKMKLENVFLTNQSALILTKRPLETAGVLHELMNIADMPTGLIKETSMGVFNDEYLYGVTEREKKELNNFYSVTPLSLSDSQEEVLKAVETKHLVSVFGPPGSGKSQTIVNLVCDLVSKGKTVLVASKMDKATDVIADRLNQLGAPYLALRAGRANYQRQLSNDLKNIISDKADFDEGYEDAILVHNDDMKALQKKLKSKIDDSDAIIKMEEEWYKAVCELEEKKTTRPVFITKKISEENLKTVEKIWVNLEKYYKKPSFFTDFKQQVDLFNLRRLLKLIDFNVNAENLQTLKEEIILSKLEAKAAKIENEIYKKGNLTEISDEIKKLQKEEGGLAREILRKNRREALKGILRDEKKIRQLKDHANAIVAREKAKQQILANADFTPFLEAFPCQCVTTYAISRSLPLKPGLFDVAIIDEASQCDIASCIPVMFRAKTTVIVGDDKQLPHLSFLENAKEQSFMAQYEIPEKYRLVWRYRTNSMFDVANYYCITPIFLDEHFRSLPPIIKFSNNEFYNGKIRIMTRDVNEQVLDLVEVPDGKVDNDVTRNLPEIEALMGKLHEIILRDEAIEDYNHKPVSIGIISPFRGQVEQIKKSLRKTLSDSTIERHNIDVGTAHTFQGDERDIILISWAIANNSFPQSLSFLQKPNLFNVAVTRARKQTISFLSKNIDDIPDGLLRDYVLYIKQYKENYKNHSTQDSIKNRYHNELEQEVAQELQKEGLTVRTGVEIAGFECDLLVTDEYNGKSIVVECDGIPDNIQKKIKTTPTNRQIIIERSGMKVVRVSIRNWRHSKSACVSIIKGAIN